MIDWASLSVLLSDWQAIQFTDPQWFALILLVPLLALAHRFYPGKNDWTAAATAKSMFFRHPLIDRMQLVSRAPGKSHVVAWLLNLLRLCLLGLIVSALANPVKTVSLPPEPQKKTVRDVVFVIESSASFLLPDYRIDGRPTTRMQVVKSVLDQFVAGLQGNRFSFIVYADQAFTLMPLTADTMTARLMLKRLKPYLAGRTDEATGEALGLALQQAEHNTQTTQKRIVILISDGMSRASRIPIAEAINYAQGLNLPIYTVGVGAGTAEADQRQFSGLLYQPLESGSLKRIAEETRGQYFQIDSRESLQKVLTKIDQTEGVEIKSAPPKTKQIELYPYLVAIALMVFILYFALVQLFARQLQAKEGR